MTLNASLTPSGNFDLSNWKLTLPVDSSGGTGGTAIEIKSLAGYSSAYFYTGSDGAMVFRAAVDGATTSGSSYARSELREMKGTERAAWNLTTGGVMTATLEVDAVPTRFDGTMGKVVVGQIHGQSDELVRLYWDNSKVYFVNDQAGSTNSETKFYFTNSAGFQPSVSLNEKFSYTIDAKGSTLEVSLYADGDVYRSVTPINSVWQSDLFYFKAGVYLGVNETQGTGYGQTSFYDLRFNHTDTALYPPSLAPVTSEPAPTGSTSTTTPTTTTTSDSFVMPTTTNTVSGSSSNNYIKGTSANDLMKGLAGRDVFWGGAGSDIMWGGSDRDADGFVFDTPIGRDVDVIMDFNPIDDYIRLENAVFAQLTKTGALSAANFALGSAQDANDFIVYDQASGKLAYDADGSGSGAAVVFAQFDNHAVLTAADFFVI